MKFGGDILYKLFASLSIIVRNFYLPNPFASFEYGVIINLMIIEPLLHMITYVLVGLFYKRGSAPAWGSFLYLFFYIVHTSLLMLCSTFSFDKIAIATIIILYIAILSALMVLKNKLFTRNMI